MHKKKSTVTIDHSRFSFNSAYDHGGGVVYVTEQCDVTIQNSSFASNEADSYEGLGGVAHIEGNSVSTINWCDFTENSADCGGAFALTQSDVSISDSTFSFNSAGYDGGVIDGVLQSNAALNNCKFDHNKATHDGGVVAMVEGSVTIDSCIANNNSAKYGGVVTLTNSTIVIENNNTFTDNTAYIDGGILASYIQCQIEIHNSRFENNFAYHDGGVAYLFNGSVTTIDGCHFTRNRASYGGVLVAKRMSDIDIDNCIFTKNSAVTDGATIYGSSLCIVSVHGSNFTNNRAGNNGDLHIAENSSLTITICDFTDNSAGHNGGVMFGYNHSILTIDSCTITNSSAGGSGGAVYGRAYTEITINNSMIEGSSAQNAGGGISAQRYSHIEITSSQFMYNTADYGGFMRVYLGSTADVTDSTFIENWSNLDGGVMAVYKSSTICVKTSSFEHNNASFGGVFSVYRSTVELNNATFFNNYGEFAGVVRLLEGSTVIATKSNFLQNGADRGGVLYGEGGDIIATSCHFNFNTARLIAAVLYVNGYGNVSFNDNSFIGNSAELSGGVMSFFDDSVATLDNCSFKDNRVTNIGGAIRADQSSVTISSCVFDSHSGNLGGVVRASGYSNITIYSSLFANNVAHQSGGVIDISMNSDVMIWDSNFTNNSAVIGDGGAMNVYNQTSAKLDNCMFEKNIASSNRGAVSVGDQSNFIIFECTFIGNQANRFGGAVTAERSSSIVIDNSLDINSQAILRNETFTDRRGTHILNNVVVEGSGGGISLDGGSSLHFKDLTHINNNEAHDYGGTIHTVGSHIVIGSSVLVQSNRAQKGGGISLANSDLYDSANESIFSDISLLSNEAEYGGALYVDDNSNSDVCSSAPSTLCFFGKAGAEFRVNFEENHANKSGDDLFGGLLDRCSIDTVTSVLDDSGLGLGIGTDLFMQISNFGKSNLTSISSEAVKLCFCDKNGEPDCNKNTCSIYVVRGDPFSISVAAVDQVRHPVSATVTSAIQGLALAENQTMQRIGEKCSSLSYQVNFPVNSQHDYNLTIYADGPCNDKGISKLNVLINIKSCTCGPGFMPENNTIRCACTCDTRDSIFTSYITECDASRQSIIREGLFWIKYLDNNDTSDNSSRYLIAPYCPLDYCQPPNVPIYINLSDGPNAQCAEYRQGLLCGSCQQGYSLSLGSSKCLKCPKNWYGLFVGITTAAILAGLLLMVFFLVLNITVGVGSFNSIIFYANIINANKTIYFRQPNLTFLPIFISWLNLDIGFDTCFFETMDTYAKTWIQLAFPAYMIFLVVVIIRISHYSKKFANLIGTRNPVATLATLILLSYTRLLQTVIIAFSFVTLTYPNGSREVYWLPDATFELDDHRLMIAALVGLSMIILVNGVLFTLFLFSWQWLLRFSGYKLFKWTQNQKLHGFVNTYHAPYMAEHRYWIGMLLLVRVLIYLIEAFSASSEQPITLLCTVIIMCCLLLFKAVLRSRVYRNKFVNVIESAIFFNVAIFALITLYTFNIQGYKKIGDLLQLQTATAYLSVGAVLVLMLVILSIHAYRYGSKKVFSCFSRQNHSKLVQMMYDQEEIRQEDSSLESSVNEFLDVLDSPRTRYNAPFVLFQKETQTLPTTTILSLPQQKKSSKRRKSSSVAATKDLKEKLNGENSNIIALSETQLNNV